MTAVMRKARNTNNTAVAIDSRSQGENHRATSIIDNTVVVVTPTQMNHATSNLMELDKRALAAAHAAIAATTRGLECQLRSGV